MRAVVIGAGWAGEGQTAALRYAGVEVVAMCSRRSETVEPMAAKLGIPLASTDWRGALEDLRPDVVAIATPAVGRVEMIAAATGMGCHIYCDKPLAATADEAERAYALAAAAGIKHAYAATQRYEPGMAWLAQLVHGGTIGALREIEVTSRYPFFPELPWGWWSTLATGGGFLNTMLPHLLGSLEFIACGPVRRVMGYAVHRSDTGPVVPGIRDFRSLFDPSAYPPPEEMAGLERRPNDSDTFASALLACDSPWGEVAVHALYSTVAAAPWPPMGWRLYGSEGTLMLDGRFGGEVFLLRSGQAEREHLPVPRDLLASRPSLGNAEESDWAALARDFVADVRGKPHRDYLTFRDGWRAQVIIDAIQAGRGWQEVA